MDTEYFITLIRDRRCLWDQKEAAYHLRNVQRSSWKEVSMELDKPVDYLKTRWRTIRDTFRRELKKSIASGSSDEASKWPYFKTLMFLKDAMESRDLRRNVSNATEHEQNPEIHVVDVIADFPYSQTEDAVSLPPQDHAQYQKQSRKSMRNKKIKRENTGNFDEGLLEIEEKNYVSDTKDSDYQFFMSLLPYIKQLHPSRRLLARGKILQVIIDEQTMQAST